MLLIQLVLIVIFFLAILKVMRRYRDGYLSLGGLALWLLFWVLVGVVALLPDSTMYAARFVGVGRGADLVVYLSLALIFYILFRIMVKMEKNEKEMTKIVRMLALREKEKRN